MDEKNRTNLKQRNVGMKQPIIKRKGKISLSLSTQTNSQLTYKNNQINTLQKQILTLNSKLQKQKKQNQKIAVLSSQIKKIKNQLINKLTQVKQKQQNQQNIYINQNYSLTSRQTIKGNNKLISQKQQQTIKESTQNPFKHFSVYQSSYNSSEMYSPFPKNKKSTQHSIIKSLEKLQNIKRKKDLLPIFQIYKERVNDISFRGESSNNQYEIQQSKVKQNLFKTKQKFSLSLFHNKKMENTKKK